jgi:hypothetical protein
VFRFNLLKGVCQKTDDQAIHCFARGVCIFVFDWDSNIAARLTLPLHFPQVIYLLLLDIHLSPPWHSISAAQSFRSVSSFDSIS